MPSPKDGKAGLAVTPMEPKPPHEADKADPGEVSKVKAEQRQTQSGKYGSTPAKPHKPPETEEEKEKKSWIEVKLIDEDDKPIPGVRYRVVLPDETVSEGALNEQGVGRVEGFEPGTCKISFPDLDKDAWEPA